MRNSRYFLEVERGMEAKLRELGQGHLLEGISAEQTANLLAQVAVMFFPAAPDRG